MDLTLRHALETQLQRYRTLPSLPPDALDPLLALATLLKTYEPLLTLALTVEAIPLAHALNDVQKEARGLAIRAYAEAQLEMDTEAYEHGQAALALSHATQEFVTQGYAYFGIGQYLINQFRYDEALEVGLRGYDLLTEAGDTAAQANILFIVMGAYSRLGKRQQAERYGRRAVEQYREIDLPGGAMVQLNNLAMHFFWMEEYDIAWHYGEQALAIWRALLATQQRFDFFYTAGAILHTLAEILLAKSDVAAAEAVLQEGLAFVRQYTAEISPNDETFLLLALGKLHCAKHELPAARHTLLTALWRAKAAHHRALKAEITYALMQLYEKMENHRRALRYCNAYHAIDRARYQDQLVSKMHQLEAEYEVKAARREMELLTEKNRQLEQAYADLQAANATIRNLSIRDGLTQLHTRQYFDEWSRSMAAQSQKAVQPFAILLGDIDNFKQINDTFLHHTGDVVLQKVAAEMQIICPTDGCAARYGGEEFVLAVPNCDDTRIYEIADALRQRIQQYPWHTVHPDIKVTISIGVTSSATFQSLNELLIQADLYMYMAKRQGKNRVVSEANFL